MNFRESDLDPKASQNQDNDKTQIQKGDPTETIVGEGNGTDRVGTQKQTVEDEKYLQIVGAIRRLQSPITSEQDIEMKDLITQNSDLLRQALDRNPSLTLDNLTHLLEVGYFNARTAAFSFLESNLSLIESKIQVKGENYGEISSCLTAISQLANSSYQDKEKLAVEVLTRHFKDITDGLKSLPEFYGYRAVGYTHALAALIRYGDSTTSQEAEKLLFEIAGVRDERGATVLAEMLKSREHYRLKVRARTLLVSELQEYGLDFHDLYQAWEKGGARSFIDRNIAANFEAIRLLESRQKGITKFLMNEYGIKNFNRYPPYLLLRQYEYHRDASIPYGVILYPRNDYNGAFSINAGALDSFANQLGKLGTKYNIRIIEAASKMDIVRSLVKLNKRYGPRQKISFAIIGGHGTKDSIQFGGTDERHLLYTEDLLGRGAQRANEFFEPNPTIVLLSCSTGTQEGIGQQLSQTLGAKVIAPDVATNIKEIKPSIVEGKLVLDAEYYHEGTTRTYVSGQTRQ